jgi:hypothetical protein
MTFLFFLERTITGENFLVDDTEEVYATGVVFQLDGAPPNFGI